MLYTASKYASLAILLISTGLGCAQDSAPDELPSSDTADENTCVPLPAPCGAASCMLKSDYVSIARDYLVTEEGYSESDFSDRDTSVMVLWDADGNPLDVDGDGLHEYLVWPGDTDSAFAHDSVVLLMPKNYCGVIAYGGLLGQVSWAEGADTETAGHVDLEVSMSGGSRCEIDKLTLRYDSETGQYEVDPDSATSVWGC